MPKWIRRELLQICILVFLLALLAAGAITTVNRVVSQRPDPEPLDVAKWQAGGRVPIHLGGQSSRDMAPFPGRYGMALGLIESSKLIGLDESDVVRLLGPPERRKEGVLGYRIPDLPLTVSDAYLYVHFENGKVARCKLQEIY